MRAAAWVLAAAAAAAGIAGCRHGMNGAADSQPAWGFQAIGPARPAPAAPPAAPKIPAEDNPFVIALAPGVPVVTQDMTIRAVQFDVLQVQAPLGEFSRSQKIWDHLDEQAVGIETQMHLQRNGLRVGLGTQESWPPVHAILETVSRRIVRVLPPSPPNSLSVSLQLNSEPLDQTVFFYRGNGTLVGGSFAGATDVFRITWEFNSDNIEQVVVYITPEVRQEQSGSAPMPTPLGVAMVPEYEGKVFKELTSRLVVGPGGYIVLGPAADVARAGLLGREFLVKLIDAEPYEMVLVIVPRVLDLARQGGDGQPKAAASGK